MRRATTPLLNGVNITTDLIKVRKVVTGEKSQHHAQGLQAALIVLAQRASNAPVTLFSTPPN